MTRLSVIICTHNRMEDYLQRVLDALARQTLPMSQWELLLIDNASHHNLETRCDLSWHPSARTVREDTLGLTPARLRGICEAKGDMLIYVDDDNLLAPNYLKTARELLQAHPFLGVIGAGALEPEFAVEPKPEIAPYTGLLALRTHAHPVWSNNPADRACVPWGAGLCVTRPVALAYETLAVQLDAHGLLDRSGERLFGNGDVAFSWAATLIGKGFGVFPALYATHLIRAERVTRQYLLRLAYDSTYSHTVTDYLFMGHPLDSAAQRWKQLLRLPIRAVRRGPFAMQMSLARIRGTEHARRLIKEQRMQPLMLERVP